MKLHFQVPSAHSWLNPSARAGEPSGGLDTLRFADRLTMKRTLVLSWPSMYYLFLKELYSRPRKLRLMKAEYSLPQLPEPHSQPARHPAVPGIRRRRPRRLPPTPAAPQWEFWLSGESPKGEGARAEGPLSDPAATSNNPSGGTATSALPAWVPLELMCREAPGRERVGARSMLLLFHTQGQNKPQPVLLFNSNFRLVEHSCLY